MASAGPGRRPEAHPQARVLTSLARDVAPARATHV